MVTINNCVVFIILRLYFFFFLYYILQPFYITTCANWASTQHTNCKLNYNKVSPRGRHFAYLQMAATQIGHKLARSKQIMASAWVAAITRGAFRYHWKCENPMIKAVYVLYGSWHIVIKKIYIYIFYFLLLIIFLSFIHFWIPISAPWWPPLDLTTLPSIINVPVECAIARRFQKILDAL